ncbi:MAG: Serine/threonine-protein kinase [Cirrosporium novae-zelandiae]|nr:MAG: Serine/threonine-protein kinase [Cirrosporium novae-zelandiae]
MRHEDDSHSRVNSNGSTPSGIATPQPDLTDKRMPGIMPSYFGQVGAPRSTNSSCPESTLVTPTLNGDIAAFSSKHHCEYNDDEHSSMASSPRHGNHEVDDHYPPLLPHEQATYPSEEITDANGKSTPVHSHQSSQNGDLSDLIFPIKSRRNTLAIFNPLSGITTNSSVHAAHISNPTSRHPSSTPDTPRSPTLAGTYFPASKSYLELKKLTENVALTPLQKNTPPQTPRALSTDGMTSEQRVLQQTNNMLSSGLGDQPRGKSETSSNASTSSGSPPVGTPKGKLSVKISEGKSLRPSFDPYVVCVFEWNEYISKGPKNGDIDTVPEAKFKNDGLGGVPIRRSDSDMGKAMAIPMKSRQSSDNSSTDQNDFKSKNQVTNPRWDHEATFDVTGNQSEIDVSVYDRSSQEAFLGHVRLCLNLKEDQSTLEGWFALESRGKEDEHVSGEIYLKMKYMKTDKRHYGPEDFQILKLIGKGTFGQVYQVRKKDTQRIYAMKVLSKKVIIQKKEVAHTLGERNILVRTAMADSPFIVGLKFSFQTPTDLYLITDYMSGGELFWHLQKEGRFPEPRAKFYIAELILALQHLHQHDIVYRDLKPENILLDANGHIALCDFGLSKANLTKNDTTNTFCGTTEYLAPEVLLDEQGYTKMVDFWSLGVLVFEMCCGWSPFYAEDTQQMYKNIAFGKVRFPRDALSTEGRNFVKGLLNRNPRHRLGALDDASELKRHPFFADIDWDALMKKDVKPPFKPKLKSALDTSNFDPEFTNALNNASSLNARAAALAAGAMPASTPLSPGMQANFKGFTFVDESAMDEHFRDHDSELMEEDEQTDEDNSDDPFHDRKKSDRMSGVVKTGVEDNIFNHDQFDV